MKLPYKFLGGYWINHNGNVILCQSNHINSIIQNPEFFHTTKNEIDMLYQTYNEKIGEEGEAREKIITEVLKKGFVRIRENKNRWSVTGQTYNTNVIITKFFQQLYEENKQEFDPFKDVAITYMQYDKTKKIDLGEIIKLDHINTEYNISYTMSVMMIISGWLLDNFKLTFLNNYS